MTNKEESKAKSVIWAENRLCTVINSAYTINALYGRSLDIGAVLGELVDSASNVCGDNTREIEIMLIAQAKTLDALFHRLLTEMIDAEHMPNLHALGDIALRAQNQSRRTLATLASLKNPKKATFIKQQNNAINQQVNNASQPENSKNSGNLANELVSEVMHEKMDDGRAIKAIPARKKSKTLATFDRAKIAPRKSQKQDERL